MAESLVEWLSERLDEDEAVAKAAARRFEADVAAFKSGRPPDMDDLPGETAAEWSGGTDEDETGYYRAAVWAGEGIATICEMQSEYDDTSPAHIAAWDPARVLAEVAAKRRIIDMLAAAERHLGETRRTAPEYRLVAEAQRPRDALLIAVMELALPYAGRDGYQEAWRPE